METYIISPDLPDFNSYVESLRLIWNNKILTNNGPFHKNFEAKLMQHLKVDNISIYSNGTLALIAALKALNMDGGEIITTPYSFVATSHAIKWAGFEPVFADVDIKTGNLDPKSVQKLISHNTVAVLPVHVYGNPCDINSFNEISKKYNLKIIYDAAHCFNVEINDKSILEAGDMSIVSFHATKVFNTIEGGAIISQNNDYINQLNLIKNFGIKNEEEIDLIGINSKMNEFQAAYGVLQLENIDKHINKRKELTDLYNELLKSKKGIDLIEYDTDYKLNYAYMPIIVNDNHNCNRDELYEKLKKHSIFARKYFHPLISNLEIYDNNKKVDSLKNANYISERVLCLPLYSKLNKNIVKQICEII